MGICCCTLRMTVEKPSNQTKTDINQICEKVILTNKDFFFVILYWCVSVKLFYSTTLMLKLCFQYTLSHFSIFVYTQRVAHDPKKNK